MSGTKDGPNEETSKNDTRTSHEGLEVDQAKTSGARASAVAFRKFVFLTDFVPGFGEGRTGLEQTSVHVGHWGPRKIFLPSKMKKKKE